MTQQIYDTKQFPFSNIHLGKPYNLNGMYFIKMFVKDSPIYVQPPKCFIKQGILKSGKKWFCDLVFSIEDGYFLTWLEQIEEIAKQKIFENRANWFETELDEHDIENSLVSPYKMFRSGKFFIIRANLPTTLDKCDLKIYDESETEIQPEDVKEETNVITILELKGIKCSARNFQFVLDVRQMLVVSPVKIFEKCIIKKTGLEREQERNAVTDNERYVENPASFIPVSINNNQNDLPNEKSSDKSWGSNDSASVPEQSISDAHINSVGIRRSGVLTNSKDNENTKHISKIRLKENENEDPSPISFDNVKNAGLVEGDVPSCVGVLTTSKDNVHVSPKNANMNQSTPEMYEFEIDLADLEKNDAFQIKPRNDVYYKLYKEAKQKAKEAKLLALSNYLEAKRLKTTYLLEDSSDSSDDEEDEDEDTDAV
jgi:hypothetical protein